MVTVPLAEKVSWQIWYLNESGASQAARIEHSSRCRTWVTLSQRPVSEVTNSWPCRVIRTCKSSAATSAFVSKQATCSIPSFTELVRLRFFTARKARLSVAYMCEALAQPAHPNDEEHGVDAGPLQHARRNDAAVKPAAVRDHQEQVHHEIDDDEIVLQQSLRCMRVYSHDGYSHRREHIDR